MRSKRSKKRAKKAKIRRKELKTLLFLLLILIVILGVFSGKAFNISKPIIKKDIYYLASDNTKVKAYTMDEDNIMHEKKELFRGMKVTSYNKTVKYKDTNYKKIYITKKSYYIKNNNLVKNNKDIILEKNMFVKIPSSIIKNIDDNSIISMTKKGDKVNIIGFDKIDNEGNVSMYKINIGDKEGYVFGKYLSYTEEEAKKNYNQELYDKVYSKVNNYYGGGNASKIDIYPYDKKDFDNNKMPESVYSLYLNCSSEVINNIDNYINFAKETKINAFVVDIKDNESPAYPADTFKNISPTNYEHAINSYESYANAIKKLKDAGFYVIGRITTFKDSYYVKDNPKSAIIDKYTNSPYLHNGSYWPSAYNRDVWYYNVSLARESVTKFGFNEINFDYVRFPDRMQGVESRIDAKNSYNEDKLVAIAGFVRYAVDELHKLNTYVSIDVFGETTNGTYTTAYGQYWPAISNIADVISGMPYPDHFENGYYGINKPWNNPYRLMNTWGRFAHERQEETLSPAKVRTWIQAYDVMSHVDSNGINYGAQAVSDEIRGLYEANITDGYITWLSNSNLNKYRIQKEAYNIDYRKEYVKNEENNN